LAASFMTFCNLMVNTGWLVHEERRRPHRR
jgi:hypothetical protein